MTDASPSVTRTILLDEDATPDAKIERLLPLVYDQLRAAAQLALAAERPDHTLEATAVVHEAYLRLVGDRQLPWANRAHFYAAAAQAMQRVLLDHARARGRQKRGGGRIRLSLSSVGDLVQQESSTIVALDEAVRRLEDEDGVAAGVVRLRFYAGLSVADTAAALGVSPRQVNRLWTYARAWLFRSLEENDDGPGRGHPE